MSYIPRTLGSSMSAIVVAAVAAAHAVSSPQAKADMLSPRPALSAAAAPPAPSRPRPAPARPWPLPESPLELKQVHVIFRHGDRSPIPPGPQWPASWRGGEVARRWEERVERRPGELQARQYGHGHEWPFGQLTKRGAAQARVLGHHLRRCYGPLLTLPPSPSPSPTDVHFPGTLPQLAGEHYYPPNIPPPDPSTPSPEPLQTEPPESLDSPLSTESTPASVPPSYPNSVLVSVSASGRLTRGVSAVGSVAEGAAVAVGEGQTGAGGGDVREGGLFVRSTDFPRTHQTAFNVLVGLLGSVGAAAEVGVEVWEGAAENLFHNDRCPRLSLLWERAWRGRKERLEAGVREEMNEMRDRLARELGATEKKSLIALVDLVECAHLHGEPLPEGVSWGDVVRMRMLLAQEYAAMFASNEVARLGMGRLVHEIMERMEGCIRGDPSTPRLVLLSGHDASVMPLSAVLGRPFDTWPSYTSSICIELWGTPDGLEHRVRVLYDGEPVALPSHPPPASPLGIEDVDRAAWGKPVHTLCTWEGFSAITGWSRMTDAEYQKACSAPSGQASL